MYSEYDNIPLFSAKHFRNYFSINCHRMEQLRFENKKFETFSNFKKNIFKFIRPSSNSIFNCHSPNGIKLIARLRVGLSHLCEHKFRYNFQDTLIQFAAVDMTSRLLFITYFIVKIIYTRSIVVQAVNFFEQILAG